MPVLNLPLGVRMDDDFVRDDLDLVSVFFANEVRQHGTNKGSHSTTMAREVSMRVTHLAKAGTSI